MPNKKVTGKKAASNASKTLKSKSTSKTSRSSAGSALSQSKAPKNKLQLKLLDQHLRLYVMVELARHPSRLQAVLCHRRLRRKSNILSQPSLFSKHPQNTFMNQPYLYLGYT